MGYSQTSRLLSLPPELQGHIYGHIVKPWSLAIITKQDDFYVPSSVNLDNKSALQGQYKAHRLKSGRNLALTCRTTHQIVCQLHKSSFDGRLFISNCLKSLAKYPFQLWLTRVTAVNTIASSVLLSPDVLIRFQNIKHFELLVRPQEGIPGSSLIDKRDALYTKDDQTLYDIADPHVSDVVTKLRTARGMRNKEGTDYAWGVIIDIHILHEYYDVSWRPDHLGFAAGFIVRWAYDEREVIARAAWDWDKYFSYWKKGMDEGTFREFGFSRRPGTPKTMNDVPEWLQWVMTSTAQQDRMKMIERNPSLRDRFGHRLKCSCSKQVKKTKTCIFHDGMSFDTFGCSKSKVETAI